MNSEQVERQLFNEGIPIVATRSAAKLLIAAYEKQGCDSDGVDCCLRCNIVAISKFAEKLCDALLASRLRVAELEQKWIPVEEKLPEEGEEVMAFITDDWEGNENFPSLIVAELDDEAWKNGQISHWQKRPAPPAKQRGEK